MSFVAAAVVGTAVVGTVVQNNAAGRAAKRAENATRDANAMQYEQFQQTREDNMPLMDLRNSLLPNIKTTALQDSSVTPQEVMSDPGYQFGLSQGQKAIQGTAAARGGLYSGRTLQALNQFGNDYGTTKFGDVFNRKQTAIGNNFNRLMGAAGMGQAGVLQTQQAGANYANNAGGNMLNNANFQNAAGMAQANNWGNLLNRGSSYATGGGGVGQNSNMFTNKGYFSNLSNGYSNDDVYWN